MWLPGRYRETGIVDQVGCGWMGGISEESGKGGAHECPVEKML